MGTLEAPPLSRPPREPRDFPWTRALLGAVVVLLAWIGFQMTRKASTNSPSASEDTIAALRKTGQEKRAELNADESRSSAAKFDGLYRAAKEMRAACTIGVSYARFGQLLSNLATEYAIAGDHLTTPTDRDLHQLYGTAIAEYNLSLAVWKMRFDDANEFGMVLITEEKNQKLRALCEEYSLVVANGGLDTGSKPYNASKGMTWPAVAWFFPAEAAPQIWPYAAGKIDKANEAVIALQRGLTAKTDL